MKAASLGLAVCVLAATALSGTSASGQQPPHRQHLRPARPGTQVAPAAPPVTLGATPPPAPADPAATPPAPPPAPPKPVVRVRPKPKEPPPPVGPVPDVKLTLEAPTQRGTWTMRVTNDGDVPVRLVADARLLVLEVTPRGASKPLRCELPADMRPGDDMERPLVLPPGRAYVERFEPRLYCFGQRALGGLAQGSIVVGRLGWLGGNKTRPPFEVASIAGVEPELTPLKDIVSPPIGLPDEQSAMLEDAAPPRPDDPDPAKLTLRGPTSIDVETPAGVGIPVTLHNAGKRAVTVRMRPETLRFEVTSPMGVEDCRWPLGPVAAMRDLFTTVAPGGSEDLTVLLSAYCSGHTFDQPGLLMIRPELDTRRASGADIALRTFDGDVLATTPVIVRLHHGTVPPRLEHPRLEPLPAPAGTPSTASPASPPASSSPSPSR